MSDLRTAAQQVLEAWDGDEIEWFKRSYTVMENLRAALAQQAEPVEPVATLIAQRDALLEALKEVHAWGTDQNYVRAKAACDKARAAIKAVEEGR